jgi:UDP-GlcNAc:undecaprenyl-phosphate/decaprenyl-phosphate GlcNAc-1-phosphate transferase
VSVLDPATAEPMMDIFFIFAPIAAFVAFMAVMVGLPVAVKRAVRSGFVDRPDNGRKDHDRPVPPIGGLVIIPVFMVLAPFAGLSPLMHWPLYVGLSLILLTGVLDDYYDLPAHWRLALQIGVATLLAWSYDARLMNLGHLFGAPNDLMLGILAVPFTIACFVFLINAMNLIDGVDGLAGGISFVMLGWLMIATLICGNVMFTMPIMVLIMCLAGFLIHNMRYPGHRKATVFLGDAGSMALGLLIAYFAINVTQMPPTVLKPIGAAMIILIPIVDTFALFIARVRAGRQAFTPGRDHIHYRIMNLGYTPGQTALILMVITLVAGGVGLLGPLVGFGEGPLTVLWIICLLGHTVYLTRVAKQIYETPE